MQINEIKQLCQDYGIRPSKSKGQNFLIGENALKQIVKAADLKKDDYVLEIGPGFGILTQELVKQSQKVLAVELDKRLLFYLKKRFRSQNNLEILEGDILKIKNQDLADKIGSNKYKVVANLPYNITKPVLRKFLTYDPKPSEMVVLVQKEVAEKILGRNGKMSILSLSVWFYGRPEIVSFITGDNFYPAPKVDSAVLRIKIRQGNLPGEIEKILNPEEQKNFQEKKFWQLIKIGFSSPRKQLHNNLSAGLNISPEISQNWLKKAGLRPDIRAEDLNLSDWTSIYQQAVV